MFLVEVQKGMMMMKVTGKNEIEKNKMKMMMKMDMKMLRKPRKKILRKTKMIMMNDHYIIRFTIYSQQMFILLVLYSVIF